MLQSRPVTNLDNSYTDYEIMHELDSSHPTETEIYSRAHWGEIFPGSSSWICLQWFWANKSYFFRQGLKIGGKVMDDCNPFFENMGIQYNQVMFNLSNGYYNFFAGYPEAKHAQSMVLSMFGHQIDDKDVLQLFRTQGLEAPKPSLTGIFSMLSFIINSLLFGPKNLIKTKEEIIDKNPYDLVDILKQYSNSKDIFNKILDNQYFISDTALKNHGPISVYTAINDAILKSILESASNNSDNIESDYNLMISSATDVISAEVPKILREIAKSIKDKQWFRQLSDEEALQELTTGTDESSQQFQYFIERHGHRGYRELDPMYKPWKGNPMPCIKTIKTILSGNETQFETKIETSVEEVVNGLKTPLTPFKKLLIKHVLLPWTRRGIGYRELSKYIMVWMNNKCNEGFWHLAKQMFKEGLIPSVDTFFYLTITEVEALCNGQRDPLIF
ncbi:unnamed protein product, partial [Medioppia subpectinata]